MLKTGICIIWYNPTKSAVNNLRVYQELKLHTVIVDNSSYSNEALIGENKLTKYLPLNNNYGIAKAQNLGIKYLKETGIDSILFLDQDSLMETSSVLDLIVHFKRLILKNIKLGGVGPQPFNGFINKNYNPKLTIGKEFLKDFTETVDLISSGSLIPVKLFEEIGYFEENLFIDGVDHEWCWRSTSKGYRFFKVKSIKLIHHLGEGDRHILGYPVAIPSPIRTYYQYRNYIRLVQRNYVPFRWKIINFVKYLIKIPYYTIFINGRLKYLKYISIGIAHGLFNDKKIKFNDK